MAFTMPALARSPENRIGVSLAVLALISGCSDPAANERFELTRVEAAWSNGQVDVALEQNLALSNEARDALIHGVPLTISLMLSLRNTTTQVRVATESNSYEIRYLPLSDHYQLTNAKDSKVKTFPRLRHVLADLSELKFSFDTGVLPSGNYELLARTRLAQESMPPPMRLPVLLSAKWHHDSSWSSWPLEIKPEA
jgi:hypothetical protein